MIRVLHVVSDSNIGGAGRVLLNYLRYADRGRFEVLAAVPRGGLLREPLESLGAAVYEVDGIADRSFDRQGVRALGALIRDTGPDVVHTHGALSGRVAARRLGVPAVVMTKHCPAARGSLPSRAAHRTLEALLADRIIAVSHAVGAQLIAAGTPERLVRVVPNGIVPVEPYDAAAREALRARLGMDAAHLWVGVAARLEPVKGVDLFLDAARRLAHRGELRFAVFGAGGAEDALRAQAEPLGERVCFAGFVREIEQALGLLDVAAVPSRAEAFCLSAAEALSMGTPVAGFDVDGVGEVVRDGETGLLVPAGDTAALAAAIERLADDAALRGRLGENGRRMVWETLTAERMARGTERVYLEILKEKRHGRE